jgi:hypothetical protein
MSNYYLLPAASQAAVQTQQSSCDSLVNMALVGAVVGGAAAAAQNAQRMQHNEIALGEALVNTGRTALVSAAATAVAGAAANGITQHGVLRLSVMFGVGAAIVYGLNRRTNPGGVKA